MRIPVVGWSLCTLLVGGGAGVLLRDAVRPAEAQMPATNYEYQTAATGSLKSEEEADKLLNSFSKEGWRFVGHVGEEGRPMAVFERPLARGARLTPRMAPPKTRAPETDD